MPDFNPGPASSSTANTMPALSNAATRPFTLVVAAADSINTAGADLICNGRTDDLQINALLTSLNSAPYVNLSGTALVSNYGVRIIFRAGTYNMSQPSGVIVDNSYLTLEGEVQPHWLAFRRVWQSPSASDFPGLPGGAQFLQTNTNPDTSGSATLHAVYGIQLTQTVSTTLAPNATYLPNQTRHSCITIKNIYFRCTQYQGFAIYGQGGDDVCNIEGNCLQGWGYGAPLAGPAGQSGAINLSLDSPTIQRNDIQDDACIGITAGQGTAPFNRILNNLIFDIEGPWAITGGGMVVANSIGDMIDAVRGFGAGGIFFNGGTGLITSNLIQGYKSSDGVRLNACTGVTVNSNYIGATFGSGVTSNTAGHGVSLIGSKSCSVSTNIIQNATASSLTTFAVNIDATSTSNNVADNVSVSDTIATHGYNSGSRALNGTVNNAGGATNNVANNVAS